MRRVFLAAVAASISVVPAHAGDQAGCTGFLQCLFKSRSHRMEAVVADPQPQKQPPPSEPLVTGSTDKPLIYNPQLKPDGTPILVGSSGRETVDWAEAKYKTGTIIVKTPERALYYVLGDGRAMKYPVGVGKEGFQWHGESVIAAKAEWPGWTPPAEMIAREKKNGHIIPPYMDGGPANPLGARAMYLGGRIYRIHGTNNEASIGGDVSSGCIRMMNADVIDLYNRVKIGAKVYVFQ